jgi:hypothetical protein
MRDAGEFRRRMIEREVEQRYGPKLRDVKRPPRLPRRKSGGIIGEIMALIGKRRPENKCPTCGATNPKKRDTCAECGAPLTPGQVEE